MKNYSQHRAHQGRLTEEIKMSIKQDRNIEIQKVIDGLNLLQTNLNNGNSLVELEVLVAVDNLQTAVNSNNWGLVESVIGDLKLLYTDL